MHHMMIQIGFVLGFLMIIVALGWTVVLAFRDHWMWGLLSLTVVGTFFYLWSKRPRTNGPMALYFGAIFIFLFTGLLAR